MKRVLVMVVGLISINSFADWNPLRTYRGIKRDVNTVKEIGRDLTPDGGSSGTSDGAMYFWFVVIGLITLLIIWSIIKAHKDKKIKFQLFTDFEANNPRITSLSNWGIIKEKIFKETPTTIKNKLDDLISIDNLIIELQAMEVPDGMNLTLGEENRKDFFIVPLNEAKLNIDLYKLKIKHYKLLFNKYGIDKAQALFNKEITLGLTTEELTDSLGKPTKIEIEELKTKTKHTYIYGNKSSGDVYVFVNNELVKLTDR